MIKLKLSLLFAFVFLNATAQNSESQILDTLNNSLDNIYKHIYKASPKEFSSLTHQFLNKLNSIEKSHIQAQKKKNLKKKDFEFELQEIYELKAKTYLEMMHHASGVRDNTDSIDYYRNEILSITNDQTLRARSHGYSAFIHYTADEYTKSIEHYNKALQILEFPESKNNRPFQIRVLVNLNASLLELEIIDIAEKNYAKLEETILDMSSHKRYKNYKALLKIEKAYILIFKHKFEESLKILNSIDEDNLDRKMLKQRYYDNLHQTYLGLKNYTLGEYYFDKAYPKDEYKEDNYYFNKLRYAIGSNNIGKADLYYKNIKSNYDNSLNGRILSDYFTLKKEHEKANIHLRRALVLMQIEETNKMNDRRAVFEFYNDFSEQLAEMKTLNKLKEQEIIDNKLLYTKIGLCCSVCNYYHFSFTGLVC